MLKLLAKFLDVLPSVAATVLAAWIITHFINPRPAEPPKAEAASVPAKAPLNGASGMSPRAVETVAVKPAAEERTETKRVVREKPASQQAKAAPPSAPPSAPASAPASQRTEERKDAADLARAALERLKQDAPEAAARTVPVPAAAAPAPAPAMTAPAVSPVAASAPAPAVPASVVPVSVPPALPPPVVITAPRDIRPAAEDASRPVPPGEIPMRADGDGPVEAVAERPSEDLPLIGGLKSAAKSLVETVIPR